MNSLTHLKDDLSVNAQGIGSMSRRALAKCCGVSPKSIRHLLNRIKKGGELEGKKSLEALIGRDLQGGEQIVDKDCTAIIEYYAFDAGRHCKEEARMWFRAIASVGLRKLIQDACGWNSSNERRLTPQEIIDLCILPVPTEWQVRFPVEYYAHLERLTGLKADGHKRPNLWAKLTKELVYDYLPNGVYSAIKKCKEETGSWEKLHQFLSEDGLKVLEHHQRTLLTIMECSTSMDELKRLLTQATTKCYQLSLLPKII